MPSALSRLSLAAALLACTALPSFAEMISVTHASGTSEVETDPKTVVVFDLASLDTLNALGVKVAGVPTAPLPDELKQYAGDEYDKVGSLFEPDYEAVNALQPDLIIVAGRSQPKYAELAKIAPTIDLTIDNAHFLDSVEANARTLGQIFDRQDEVEARISALEQSVSALQGQTRDAGTALVLLTTGGKVSAFGPGSRFGNVYDLYGFAAADPGLDVGTHGQAVSFEYILKTNPDWLYVLDRDATIGQTGTAASVLLDNDLVDQTTAWQKGQVIYPDGGLLYLTTGGLYAEQALVDQVAARLKGEATD
ncbi:siderophore ABC transporter substrate-binding protein [Martelella alba]|uniref:Siderophore ABC transporter substrate-binding protein n=1 Tax=Martelella alba TaxID=2590451 RepID=A0A506U7K0_9HYPH|nr:siderophore ABC transporter substrate-binding protein [Martelella alba]TPW28935.1 siderophore ABC transporter substrate-binding protein [Martelella alba]